MLTTLLSLLGALATGFVWWFTHRIQKTKQQEFLDELHQDQKKLDSFIATSQFEEAALLRRQLLDDVHDLLRIQDKSTPK